MEHPTTIALTDDLAYARALKAHLARFGRREPGREAVIDGLDLGRWWHEDILTHADDLDDRTRALVSVAGVQPQTPDTFSDQALWDAVGFVAANPCESAPPARWVSHSGLRVGVWVRARAVEYRTGELADDHQILVRYGLLVPQRSQTFEHLLDDLDAFIDEHGHAEVPARAVSADGHRLGERLGWLRSEAHRHELTSEQYLALLRRGVEMHNPHERRQRSFDEWYTLLGQWVREHEGALPRDDDTYAGAGIGHWVRRQADLARAGAMSRHRHTMFTRLGIPMPDPTKARQR
jgi:hypothetical protein